MSGEADLRLGRGSVSDETVGPYGNSVSFKLPATELVGRVVHESMGRVVDALAPANPVVNAQYFVGRTRQLTQLIDAIEEHRNHILLCGPRGCGKTSLALTLLSAAQRAGYIPIYLSCSRNSTFETLFRFALRGISRRYDGGSTALGDLERSSFLDLLSSDQITPQVVGDLLSRVTGTRILIVLDDFDFLQDSGISADLTELAKNLSDHAAAVHLILIGNGNSTDDLLCQQPSMPRSLFRLKLDHMNDEELADLLTHLTKLVGLEISAPTLKEILALALGKIFIAKLVALRAAKIALMRNVETIELADFDLAFHQLHEHFSDEGLPRLQAVVTKNPALRYVFKAISGTVREIGDTFSAEDVFRRCGQWPDTAGLEIQQIERILNSLTDVGSLLAKSKTDNDRTFRVVDPNIELALAIVSYEALSDIGLAGQRSASRDEDFEKRVVPMPVRQFSSNFS